MFGVFSAIRALLNLLYSIYYTIYDFIAEIWVFFELYGWRILIGSIAGYHFLNRLVKEHERRAKASRVRALAADTSRNVALNERREEVVQRIGETYKEAMERKRREDEEFRLQRIRDLEAKLGGSGHRLGSIVDDRD